MDRYELLLLGEFSAAHRLRMYDGRDEPLHGHNWRVEVHVEADRLDEIDVVADFNLFQEHLRAITSELHNQHLNELPAFRGGNPSTERVARHVHDALVPRLPPEVRIVKVRVWETGECAAAYVPGPGHRPSPGG